MARSFQINLNRTSNHSSHDVGSQRRPQVKTELDHEEQQKVLTEKKDAYKEFTEGEVPCKHIFEEIFFTELHDPYTAEGHRKLQWADHQIKASLGYIEGRTSSKKNLKQLAGIKDAGALSSWLNAFLAAVQLCEKKPNALRSEKWDAETQLGNSGKMLSALISARKSLNARIASLSPNMITETVFNKNKTEVFSLWKSTPDWMQRLAKGALRVIRTVFSTNVLLF